MKTITISYVRKTGKTERKKNFSAIIDELIKKNLEKRIELLIESSEKTGYEGELEKISKEIRRGFRVRI